jgi:large subunit ribosomal protein L6
MSRLGKKPISLPSEVRVGRQDDKLKVKGPLGELELELPSEIKVEIKEQEIKVKVAQPQEKKQKALWGLYWALIRNMVIGVKEGYQKNLEIQGIGYKARKEGDKLVLQLGFSHPVEFKIPKGITIEVEKNIIKVRGIDKQLVGQTAAEIRKLRPPDAYKGKGIRYQGEKIKLKPGKAAKGAEGTT